MTRKRFIIFSSLLVVSIALPVFIYLFREAAIQSRYGSDHNHRGFIDLHVLHYYLEETGGVLPYDEDVPGYAMFAKFCSERTPAHVNCNHGAFHARVGGWQVVNLPRDKWNELHKQWESRSGGGVIPFAWCGKPTKLGKRLLFTASRDNEGKWDAGFNEECSEQQLKIRVSRLNECLTAIQKPSVTMDIPDDVDWYQYDNGYQLEKEDTTAESTPSKAP